MIRTLLRITPLSLCLGLLLTLATARPSAQRTAAYPQFPTKAQEVRVTSIFDRLTPMPALPVDVDNKDTPRSVSEYGPSISATPVTAQDLAVVSERRALRPTTRPRSDVLAEIPPFATDQAATATPVVTDTTPLPDTPPPMPRNNLAASRSFPPLEVGPGLPGMPDTVVVGRTYAIACTAPSRTLPTQQLSFVDYLRNVLPNEWDPSWPTAALDAGAIAVKQFAWHTIVIERKWRSQGYPFDILDSTCDQYYRDASADARTDAALQRTWGTLLMRDGLMLATYYRDTEARCGGRTDCLGQVESAKFASEGYSTHQILARAYAAPGTVVRETGSQLPTQLPPVPPAPAVRPQAAATAISTAAPPSSEQEQATAPPPAISPTPTTVNAAVTVLPPETLTPLPYEQTQPTESPPTPVPATPTPAIAMPDLVGMPEADAQQLLAQLGMRPYVIVDYQGSDRLGEHADQLPPFVVISQKPPAGVLMKYNQLVVLGVRAP